MEGLAPFCSEIQCETVIGSMIGSTGAPICCKELYRSDAFFSKIIITKMSHIFKTLAKAASCCL